MSMIISISIWNNKNNAIFLDSYVMVYTVIARGEIMKTVKEASRLSDVSVCTLYYYDQIDLLKLSYIAENAYCYYDELTFERLQEILLVEAGVLS